MKTKNESRFHFPSAQGLRGEPQTRGPRAGLLVLLAACAALCNCTHVPLMKRGKLADYTMSPDRDPLGVSLREHVFFSREGASGGRAIGGGGCGCN